MQKPKIIAITGPTASGKTGLAIEIFKQLNVELINMDSAQIYKDMDIGTAKITKEEQQLYPHHLINIINPEQSYSASSFVENVNELVPQIIARGNIPIVVGGTMLYYKTLIEGIADLPKADEKIRKELKYTLEEKGHQYLQEELEKIDPLLASKIQGNDTQRLIRFLEIAKITGQAPSKLFAEQDKVSPFDFFHISIIPKDRATLHDVIEKRFNMMLDDGLLEELTQLREKYNITLDNQSMRSVGYRQAWMYQDGEFNHGVFSNKLNTPYTEMRDRGVFATRQLAKRQLTWLRKFDNNILIEDMTSIDFNEIINKVSKFNQ